MMPLALLSTILLAAAPQDAGAPVSLDLPAMSASKVVAALTKAVGQTFETSPETADEILLIRVKSMPLNVLMRDIATATGAEWKQEPMGYRLVRSKKLADQQEAEDRKKLAEVLRKLITAGTHPGYATTYDEAAAKVAMEKLSASSKALQAPSQATPELYAAQRKLAEALSPASRAISGILASLDPSAILACPVGCTRTFALRPSRYQYTLGPGAAEVIKRFVKEESYFISETQGLDPSKLNAAIQQQGRYAMYGVPIVEPVRAELKVVRYYQSMVSLTLAISDADGYLIDMGNRQFELTQPGETNGLPRYNEWKTTALALTKDSKTLLTTASNRSSARLDNKLFSDPSTRDPLSFVVQDGILQVGKACGLDVVACLPDSALGAAIDQAGQKNPTIEAFVEAISPEVRWRADGKVLTVTPTYPAMNRSLQFNRGAFSSLMATAQARGFPVLDDIAQYALQQRDGAYPFEWRWLMLNALGDSGCPATQGLSGAIMGYREIFRLYALLTPAQRSALDNGQSLTLRELTPAAREQLSFRLYARDVRLRVQRPFGDRQRSHWAIDSAADLLPNGLPLDATISAESASETGGFEDAGGSIGRFWDCGSIGYVQWQQDHGQFLDPNMGYPPMSSTKFRPGSTTTIHFMLAYADGLTDQVALKDMRVDPKSTAVTWMSLPKEYADQAQKVYDFYRNTPVSRRKQDPPPLR